MRESPLGPFPRSTKLAAVEEDVDLRRMVGHGPPGGRIRRQGLPKLLGEVQRRLERPSRDKEAVLGPNGPAREVDVARPLRKHPNPGCELLHVIRGVAGRRGERPVHADPHPELPDVALGRSGQIRQERERSPEVAEGVEMGGALGRALARALPPGQRLVDRVGFTEVMPDQLRLVLRDDGKLPHQAARDPLVVAPLRRPQQRPIGDLVRQRVPERVFEIRSAASLVDEPRGLQPGQAAAQLLVGSVRDRPQEGEADVLADGGGHLEQLLVADGQPIDASREHGVHGRRNAERGDWRPRAARAGFSAKRAGLD